MNNSKETKTVKLKRGDRLYKLDANGEPLCSRTVTRLNSVYAICDNIYRHTKESSTGKFPEHPRGHSFDWEHNDMWFLETIEMQEKMRAKKEASAISRFFREKRGDELGEIFSPSEISDFYNKIKNR